MVARTGEASSPLRISSNVTLRRGTKFVIVPRILKAGSLVSARSAFASLPGAISTAVAESSVLPRRNISERRIHRLRIRWDRLQPDASATETRRLDVVFSGREIPETIDAAIVG